MLLLAASFSAVNLGAQQPQQSLNDYFKQARDLEDKQDFAGAEKVYFDAMASFPNQPEILKRLGIVYQTEFKFQESIETFERILKQTPEYPETNFFLGYSYFGQNLFDKAIEMFQKELVANPKYRRAHYYSGLAFESLNRIGDAIREFEILLKDDPADTKVLYQLARIHKASSMTAVKQLSHVAPDSVFFHVLRAESYMEDEKYPEAIKEYKLVSALDPGFPGVHLGLGQIYYKQVNPTESEKEFRLALREDVNHPLANYYLGELLLRALKPKEGRMITAIVNFKLPAEIDAKKAAELFKGSAPKYRGMKGLCASTTCSTSRAASAAVSISGRAAPMPRRSIRRNGRHGLLIATAHRLTSATSTRRSWSTMKATRSWPTQPRA
jgi:tetratricopeptide (TPR) repeat protein